MSKIINVSTQSELYDALANATGGDTILLAEGSYGDIALTRQSGFDLTFDSEITIASADPQNPAVFSGMDIRETSNLTFDGITFDYTFAAGDDIWDRPFNVSESENITIRNSTFDGDLASGVSEAADGYGYAIGLSFRDSTGVTVAQNEFFDFYRGMTISDSSDINVTGNDIHSLRMDGLNFSAVTNVLIEENHIHDFNASLNSTDHADMIQFWTNGTDTPSTDITIRANYLDIGAGDATQSIFMRNDQVDRGLAGEEMFYQNILIENNVIVNGHRHGITVGETDGLIIQNNSVLHDDGRTADGTDSAVEIPRISVSEPSHNVMITQNLTSEVNGYTSQSDWNVDANALVQDQVATDPGYYADVFVSSSLLPDNGVHSFLALPGGLADALNAGAPSTLLLANSPALMPRFHVEQSQDNAALYHFDASMTTDGYTAAPAGTIYQWEFADGTILQGQDVSHAFASGGAYNVRLTVQLPSGQQAQHDMMLDVSGSNVLSFNAATGMAVGNGEESTFSAAENTMSAAGIITGNQGNTLRIDRENVADVLNQDEFSICLEITADTAGSAGEIMRLHGSFITSVTDSGEIYFEATTTDGQRIRLTTEDANIADMNAHEVDISLQDNELTIEVDGDILASMAMTAPLANQGAHDLVFGNPWGRENFEGVVSALDIAVNQSDYSQVTPAVASMPLVTLLNEAVSPRPAGEGQEAAPRIERAEVADVLGQDTFSISMGLTADSLGNSGEVMRLHQSFITSVTEAGEVHFSAFTEAGERIRLTTENANIADMNAHEVDIVLQDNVLAIRVDGNTLASTAMTAPLANEGAHDLVFGNPWGRDSFEGVVSTFSASVSSMPADAAHNTPTASIFDSLELPRREIENDQSYVNTTNREQAWDTFESMLLLGNQDGFLG